MPKGSRPRTAARRKQANLMLAAGCLAGDWQSITRRAAWKHPADVRDDLPRADTVDAFTVFNIGGNKYRLISAIKYRWQIVYLRQILTHVECDKGRWNL
jgi:mRNA interferase HigB